MSGDHNMNQTDSGWRKRQIALDKKAENARELGLDYDIHHDSTKRTWVGLTDEDKHLIELSAGITEDDDGYIVSQVFKLTEAKLKEKNT